MKSKLYLIFLLLVIMAAGAWCMFHIAFNGMAKEHDGAPDRETTGLMLMVVWFILMMIGDVLLLNYKTLPRRKLYTTLLSIGIFAPALYILISR